MDKKELVCIYNAYAPLKGTPKYSGVYYFNIKTIEKDEDGSAIEIDFGRNIRSLYNAQGTHNKEVIKVGRELVREKSFLRTLNILNQSTLRYHRGNIVSSNAEDISEISIKTGWAHMTEEGEYADGTWYITEPYTATHGATGVRLSVLSNILQTLINEKVPVEAVYEYYINDSSLNDDVWNRERMFEAEDRFLGEIWVELSVAEEYNLPYLTNDLSYKWNKIIESINN